MIKNLQEGLTKASKDPVNLFTGNFIYASKDLSIDEVSPLEFSRFYNAIDDSTGELGFNWRHSYEIKLAHLDGGAKEITFNDGHKEKFDTQI